mmetsp:Transcript_38561/g.49175  ORF Transcript_38561/g.49175 Transcript_38561/m.49175 type:complete len:473 (+) Transcript_38561:64-1482(+)
MRFLQTSAILIIIIGVLVQSTVGFSFGQLSNTPLFRQYATKQSFMSMEVEKLNFLTPKNVAEIRQQFGTPTYVYGSEVLKSQASKALNFPNAYGLTVRFAMKACPNAAILQLFNSMGLHIDASSVYEVERAVKAGVPPSHISLSTQELPSDFGKVIEDGTKLNACSLDQLERFGKQFPGQEVGIRFNPGQGSGGTGKTNVGGPSSSFGIWFELLPQVKEIVAKYDLKVVRIHTHIGSGSDPEIWQKVSQLSLNLCKEFPDVHTMNLGGGYKVGRMSFEKSTDLSVVGAPVKDAFVRFAEETGRELHLEIEPGTFLVANSGALVTTVQDKVTTGDSGHTFLKMDGGMTDVLRPSLYGALHPIIIVPTDEARNGQTEKYVVVGHCCESGDLLTPANGEPETIEERELYKAEIGDALVVEGCGAYCSSMSTKNYNSFLEAPEVMVGKDGSIHLIRRRQDLSQILQNEVPINLDNL